MTAALGVLVALVVLPVLVWLLSSSLILTALVAVGLLLASVCALLVEGGNG